MTALSRLWSMSVQKYQQPGFVICAGTWPGILWPSNAIWPASVVGGAPEAGLPTGLHWAHLLRVLLQSKGHLQLACTLHGQERGHDPSAKSGKPAYQENHFIFPLLLQEALNSDVYMVSDAPELYKGPSKEWPAPSLLTQLSWGHPDLTVGLPTGYTFSAFLRKPGSCRGTVLWKPR